MFLILIQYKMYALTASIAPSYIYCLTTHHSVLKLARPRLFAKQIGRYVCIKLYISSIRRYMYTNIPNTHCDATLFCLICSKGYSTLEVRLAAAATMTTRWRRRRNGGRDVRETMPMQNVCIHLPYERRRQEHVVYTRRAQQYPIHA